MYKFRGWYMLAMPRTADFLVTTRVAKAVLFSVVSVCGCVGVFSNMITFENETFEILSSIYISI